MSELVTKKEVATVKSEVPAIQQSESSMILSALIDLAKDPTIEIGRLEKLMSLQERLEDRQAEKLYSTAIAKFQGECPTIQKSKKVKFESSSGKTTQYNYSPLDEIVSVIKPILAKNELSYSFDIIPPEKGGTLATLQTKISHAGGHSVTSSLQFPEVHDDQRMNASQRRKSAISFAKRAGLENALGIVTTEEDDDARRAHHDECSPEQVQEINELIKKTGTTLKTFLDYAKVSKVEDMTKHEAKKAIATLKQKRSRSVHGS